MNKYVVMTGRDDVVVLNADDNKAVTITFNVDT